MATAEHELQELYRILTLPKTKAQELVVEMNIKKKSVKWGKDGTPENKLEEIILAIIAKHFSSKELALLARTLGVKTPRKAKIDIASAIVGRKCDVLSAHKASMRQLLVSRQSRLESLRDSASPGDSEDEEAKGPLLGSSDNKVAQQMWDDFTLADLVQLAKEHGAKRDGVNWGKDGTPRKNKREIIDALIAKAGTDRSKDLQDCSIDTGHWLNFYVADSSAVPDKFMDPSTYRDHLMRTVGLQHDQDVFHIIASANGGPDHPDNYLGALNSVFNRSIQDKMDYFCCFIAGLEKVEKAISRAVEAEQLYRADPKHNSHVIDRRGHEKPVLWSENSYNCEVGRCLTAAELVQRGRTCWAKMRLAAIE